ncbi:MAG: AAA family ATPase [bacterium]|nr:AAA family ATPase [bacterium]
MAKNSSLSARRRAHIFTDPQKWKPLAREDVRGADYLFEIIDPVVALLKLSAQDKKHLNIKFSGMLFYGESGTGKTYIARYIASASGVRFVIGNSFPREHDEDEWTKDDMIALFENLRAYVKQAQQPVILFFDQFDSVIASASEEATAQLYTELDGMSGPLEGILVIGATTIEQGELDPQLVRPGRLGTTVAFFSPNRKGRAEILRYYLDQSVHEDIAIEDLAPPLTQMTPATLKHLIDMARERAQVRAGESEEKKITKEDVLCAFIRIAIKPQGPNTDGLSVKTKRAFAVHEIGHAVVGYVLGRMVTLVHVIPTTTTGGETYIEASDEMMKKDDLRMLIAESYGGIIAGEICGMPSEIGGGEDLESATAEAYDLVQKFGSGLRFHREFGLLTVGEHGKSDKLAELIEEDVGGILRAEEKTARDILGEVGKETIITLADILVTERILFSNEFSARMKQFGIEQKTQRPR